MERREGRGGGEERNEAILGGFGRNRWGRLIVLFRCFYCTQDGEK